MEEFVSTFMLLVGCFMGGWGLAILRNTERPPLPPSHLKRPRGPRAPRGSDDPSDA